MERAPAPQREPGLRELNKQEKRQRISAAARELFLENGYDVATVRDIAARARVALGTVFNYAEDKSDLVFLIANEDLRATVLDALDAVDPAKPLMQQVLTIFRKLYEFFGSEPRLSKIVLRELSFESEGKNAEYMQQTRRFLLSGLEVCVERARQRDEIDFSLDARSLARSIFFIYAGAVRWWIQDPEPTVREGLQELKRYLDVHFNGLLSSRDQAVSNSRSDTKRAGRPATSSTKH